VDAVDVVSLSATVAVDMEEEAMNDVIIELMRCRICSYSWEDWLVEQSCSRVKYCYVRVEG